MMNNESSVPGNVRDEMLWKLAKKRAGFKWSFLMYIVVNLLLIAIWYLTDRSYFWPVWPLLGWGIGMAMQYFDAYHSNHFFSVENEYNKLKNKSSN